MRVQDRNYWIQRALVVVLITFTLLDHQVLVSTHPTAERNNDANFVRKDSDDSPEETGLVVPEKRGRNAWG
ncbi:hypothetical protein PHET_01965 [Paragonimus heterotremus]|uniref:Secreted protein n=1 Tax=Paragonimus heterotremus TaxID=100268 RepID=A0A8J4TQS3_9TREM|nr:hypothetical protein PHET_01965 [Paragonimus heterotremus]